MNREGTENLFSTANIIGSITKLKFAEPNFFGRRGPVVAPVFPHVPQRQGEVGHHQFHQLSGHGLLKRFQSGAPLHWRPHVPLWLGSKASEGEF